MLPISNGIVYLQVVALLSAADMHWPARVRQTFSAFSALNFAFESIAHEECTAVSSAAQLDATLLLLPAIAAVLVAGATLNALTIKNRRVNRKLIPVWYSIAVLMYARLANVTIDSMRVLDLRITVAALVVWVMGLVR